MKSLSIVIPAYREADNLTPLISEISTYIGALPYDYEIIIVNDGSPDHTWEVISRLAEHDPRIKGINLSRNFGKEIALTAGLAYARGDAVITLDADGQHPPSRLPDFITSWEAGYHIVYNKRPETRGASWFKRLSSRLFYWIFNHISDFKLEPGTTDYRLLDRVVVHSYLQLREKNRIYRGLVDWLGFSKKALVFDAEDRRHGEASYNYRMLLRLAIHGVTSFSCFPLKLTGGVGFGMSSISVLLFVFVIVDKFTIDRFAFSNIAAIMLVNTFLIGIVMIALGLIGIYIANIHEEVINRPLYFVRGTKNITTQEPSS